MYDHNAAENGGLPHYGGIGGSGNSSGGVGRRKSKSFSTMRIMLISIAGLLFAALLLYSQLVRHKPGLDPEYGLRVGAMKGKLKGFPKVKRIMQRRGLAAKNRHSKEHTEAGHHEGEADHAHPGAKHGETVTKEMDLEHLEHAGFDPEAAAYEDGLDPEDLGYDEEDEEEFGNEEEWAEGEHHEAEHGEVHEGHEHHAGSRGSNTRNMHVGDDSSLHAGEEHLHHAHSHHRHDGHGEKEGHLGHHGHVPGHGGPTAPPLKHHGGWKEHEGHEDDPHDREHKIKVRARLAEIFPMVDTNRDMHIDQAEMLTWHVENGKNASARRARREFAWADTNKDGQVTLAEYLADLLPDDFQGNESDAQIDASAAWKDPTHDWILNNKVLFRLADADRSGGLNPAEHFAFSHPEESGSAALHHHLLTQDVADRDRDKDGRLDFSEFLDQMWFTLTEWEHPDVPGLDTNKTAAQERFAQLDTNKDGFLLPAELTAVFQSLHPGEHEYAHIQALHQLEAADNSGDGKLTLNEMISNPYVFYGSSVVDEEYHEEPELHDEF